MCKNINVHKNERILRIEFNCMYQLKIIFIIICIYILIKNKRHYFSCMKQVVYSCCLLWQNFGVLKITNSMKLFWTVIWSLKTCFRKKLFKKVIFVE